MKMKKKTTKMSSGKMSAKDKFKAMMEAKKKGKEKMSKGAPKPGEKGKMDKMSYGKKKTKKMSITAAKPKVVKHKKSGRV